MLGAASAPKKVKTEKKKKGKKTKAANVEVLARGVRGKSHPGREVPASTWRKNQTETSSLLQQGSFHPHLPHQRHSHPDPSTKASWPLTLPRDKLLLPLLFLGWHDRSKFLLLLLLRQVIVLLKGSIFPVH